MFFFKRHFGLLAKKLLKSNQVAQWLPYESLLEFISFPPITRASRLFVINLFSNSEAGCCHYAAITIPAANIKCWVIDGILAYYPHRSPEGHIKEIIPTAGLLGKYVATWSQRTFIFRDYHKYGNLLSKELYFWLSWFERVIHFYFLSPTPKLCRLFRRQHSVLMDLGMLCGVRSF